MVSLSELTEEKNAQLIVKAFRVFQSVSVDLTLKKPLGQGSTLVETEVRFGEEGLETMKRRNKERKIGYVVKKVSEWRKLYFYNPTRTINCKEAAAIVGISKKSLDDFFRIFIKNRI